MRTLNTVGAFLQRRAWATPNLGVDELLSDAARAAGSADWGDEMFLEPLQVLLHSLERDADLHFSGRWLARKQISSLLENRLKMEREWRLHPEILEQPVTRPVFIVGLPRSGTTFFQQLLGCDPTNRSLLHWEALRPTPPPDRATYDNDPRIKEVARGFELFYRLAPTAKVIHPQQPRLPTECVSLLAHSFASMEFCATYNVDGYLSWLLEQDLTPHYAYHRQQLQLLQWRCGAERWVLKSPAHLFFLDALLEVFPDAVIVQIHRDPLAVLPSYCSLVAVASGVTSDHVDLRAIGARWPEVWSDGIGRTMQVRDRYDDERFVDVFYDELLQDPLATVADVYEALGLHLSPEATRRMGHLLQERPQHKYGKHQYSLEQFGLDVDEERERFGPYLDRFGIASTVQARD